MTGGDHHRLDLCLNLPMKVISFSSLKIEERIGEGSFSEVFRVRRLAAASRAEEDEIPSSSSPSSSSSSANNVFALKCPKVNHHHHDLPAASTTPSSSSSSSSEKQQQQQQQQQEETESNIKDLLSEASILSKLSHKNIIKAVGMSYHYSEQEQQEQQRPTSIPMLLLELLDCTLADKLNFWRKEQKQQSQQKRSNYYNYSLLFDHLFINNNKRRHKKLFRSRTEHIVKGIANGMEYLHSQNIVLRDLKPENIGFTSNGEVKLFDFGFACCVVENENENHQEEECCSTSTTELAGSLRYMSPEILQISVTTSDTTTSSSQHVITTTSTTSSSSSSSSSDNSGGRSSNSNSNSNSNSYASDVYSFGIVLWEIATLQKAFNKELVKKINKNKSKGQNNNHSNIDKLLFEHLSKGRRLNTKSILNIEYKNLIQQCWDTNPITRPSFVTICNEWLSLIYPSSSDDADAVVDEQKQQQKQEDNDVVHDNSFGSYIYKLYEEEDKKKKKKKKQGGLIIKEGGGGGTRSSHTHHNSEVITTTTTTTTTNKKKKKNQVRRYSTEPMSDSDDCE